MFIRSYLVTTLTLLTLIAGTANADMRNYFSVKYGPAWSNVIWVNNENGKRTGWDVGLEAGYIIDKRVALGFATDLQWHYATQSIDTGRTSGGTQLIKVLRDERSFMFPVGGFLMIDPKPEWVVHPSAHLQVAYNSLVFYRRDGDNDKGDAYYFMGFLLRGGLDATVNISESAGFFAGAFAQWADMYHGDNSYRNMNGWGIRAGLKVIY